MTALARPLAVKWRGSSGGCGACDLGEIPIAIKREDSMLLDLEEAVAEHNDLVAAHEADRALIETLVAALEKIEGADSYIVSPANMATHVVVGPCGEIARAALAAAGRAER